MRYLLCFLFLTGCAVHAAEPPIPPRGEQIFNALLKNGNVDLATEPLCKADINLYEQIALALSVSYENDNKTVIESHCSPSKHEMSAGNVVDVWDCTVQINENNKKGEFISSSTIVFSLTLKNKEFIKGSLRCR
jgi:hypothetical protein